jgi:hypothetical protein
MRHINSGADDQFTDEISGFHGAKMSMLIYWIVHRVDL